MAPLLAGCAEDRSNLIPKETSESLLTKISLVDELAAQGQCFEAKEVAASAQTDIENLRGEIDPELKRSLLDGVTQLQVLVGDQETCTESGTETEEPAATEETPIETQGTTGETGTTDTAPTPTGEQGPTDDEQPEQEQPDGNGSGETPTNPPVPTPTPTPTPTPDPGGPAGPGSGGIGPG